MRIGIYMKVILMVISTIHAIDIADTNKHLVHDGKHVNKRIVHNGENSLNMESVQEHHTNVKDVDYDCASTTDKQAIESTIIGTSYEEIHTDADVTCNNEVCMTDEMTTKQHEEIPEETSSSLFDETVVSILENNMRLRLKQFIQLEEQRLNNIDRFVLY